jgi:flavin-dependent dehydrogenase
VGDAAGFLDAITGEGVSLALITARLAAATVAEALDANDLSAARLRPYEAARDDLVRDYFRLTRLLLFAARTPAIARRTIDTMRRHPDLFRKLLAINGGYARFRDLTLGDWRRLALGA